MDWKGTGKVLSNGNYVPWEPWGCDPTQPLSPAAASGTMGYSGSTDLGLRGVCSSFLNSGPSFSQIIHFAQLIDWFLISVRKVSLLLVPIPAVTWDVGRDLLSCSKCSYRLTLTLPLPSLFPWSVPLGSHYSWADALITLEFKDWRLVKIMWLLREFPRQNNG